MSPRAVPALLAIFSVAALTALIGPASAVAGAAPPSRPEYVAAADQICGTALQRAKKFFHRGRKLIRKGHRERGAKKIIKAWRRRDAGFDDVGDLERPVGDEATIERWLVLEAKATKLSIRAVKAYAQERGRRARKLKKRAVKKHERAVLVVSGYGFETCA